jgi:DNA-directed RNA polymerase subunit K/omega
MTKYERARVLGTRALQIRLVPPGLDLSTNQEFDRTCTDIVAV